jgi:predicted butyrate kinase (DUF1464 family)
MPLRVAGTDPGTSSLDVLLLEDARVADQCRISPADLQADPRQVARWLQERVPLDLIAGPSGYGLPLVRAGDCTERDLDLMTLVRPEEHGKGQGVLGFRAVVRGLIESGLPVIFLPGVIHLPTVPAHRKLNRIDLGTADKLCVAALALCDRGLARADFCLVELGSAFTACLVVQGGRIVDGLGGSSGPVGWQAAGAWDGEAAYLLGPLAKGDLFAGGPAQLADRELGRCWFRESVLRAVASLHAATPFQELVLSGRLLETELELAAQVEADLGRLGRVTRLAALPGAWVKHAAQGAAVLADGLADGRYCGLVEHMQLRRTGGTVLDWLVHPRGQDALRLLP